MPVSGRSARRLSRIATLLAAVGAVVACGGAGSTTGGSPSAGNGNGGGGNGGGGTDDGSGDGSSVSYSTELKNGVATFYDATGGGNCSFDETPDDLDVTALGFAEYAESAMCGACMRVNGPKGEVTVRMVDSCPGCEVGHLDLSKEAFAKIAEPEEGRVSITYQVVSCAVRGPVAYRFKDGSSKWWTAIQVLNHRVPIAKLEYQKNGQYVAIRRADYNYFVVDDGVGDLPNGLRLRLTAADGQVLEDDLPGAIESEKTVQGAKQFQ